MSSNLKVKGMDEVLRGIEKYAESIESKSAQLVRELCKFGEQEATLNAISMDISMMNEIMAGISYTASGSVGSVFCYSDHVAFVEFGTGVKEASNEPHPKRDEFGMGQGTYGAKGNDPNGWWFYVDDGLKSDILLERGMAHFPSKGGYVFHTFGMPARPFMFNAGVSMRNEIVPMARRIFKHD